MKRIALLNVNNKVNKTVIWTSDTMHAYFRIVSEILLDISKDNVKKIRAERLQLDLSDLFLFFVSVVFQI